MHPNVAIAAEGRVMTGAQRPSILDMWKTDMVSEVLVQMS